MKKILSTELTSANIAQALDLLAQTPERLSALTGHVPSEQLRQPLGRGERSVTAMLAHLVNSEARSSEMIYQALLVNEPFFANLHPERDLGKLCASICWIFQNCWLTSGFAARCCCACYRG